MNCTILIEPLLFNPLLLDPPLVVDAIQEVPMQDDHLAIEEEEEEDNVIAKEVQALDKGTGGTILIESLLNPS